MQTWRPKKPASSKPVAQGSKTNEHIKGTRKKGKTQWIDAEMKQVHSREAAICLSADRKRHETKTGALCWEGG